MILLPGHYTCWNCEKLHLVPIEWKYKETVKTCDCGESTIVKRQRDGSTRANKFMRNPEQKSDRRRLKNVNV